MPYDKPFIHTQPVRDLGVTTNNISRTIYYGEVISINDETDGGRIKVKIADLDNRTANDDLPWCYPLLPKFFHLYPQIGEMVRIFIEDIKFPQRSRFWLGSIISQPQKIGLDTIYNALSTTNMGLTVPDPAPATYPASDGVFPTKTDVAIIGRVNTDIILRINELHLRAGKHENDDILTLNSKNPAEISLIFEPLNDDENNFYSNTVILSDKIALISHSGNPKFKSSKLETKDRDKIFKEGHPLARADVLVEALELMRKAIVQHIHAYSGLPVDTTAIINDLNKIDFNAILQKNIVIN
jgi:hypothetical protein